MEGALLLNVSEELHRLREVPRVEALVRLDPAEEPVRELHLVHLMLEENLEICLPRPEGNRTFNSVHSHGRFLKSE